jgi:myo-inositol-1(or 4)-monophosphatase
VTLEQFEAAAVELASQAGQRAIEAFRASVALEFKGRRQNDPVTVIDRETETFLRAGLRAAFPSHGLLGEEHADDIAADAEYVWVIDPIDGTTNFASGLPLWGISVGLLHHGVPIVGSIWVPVGPTLGSGAYHAHAGGGAWFGEQPVHVSQAPDERGQIMSLPGDYLRAFRMRRADRAVPRAERALPDGRTTGSCTAEMMLIASGALRAGIMVRPSIWDVAAGVVIAREAGGEVLTWAERRWQPFTHFVPEAPIRGKGALALRHWGRPLIIGAPEAVTRIVGRLAWHPRLPRRLQKLFGLDQPG